MTTRYPGGLIRKTPPTITPPVGGEGGSAPGVWTLEQASYYTKQGTWPKPILPKNLYAIGGFNGSGELGLNNTTTNSSPVQIGSEGTWLTVSAGYAFSSAIKDDGTMWSWGYNAYGQLGQNISTSTNKSSPVQIGALTTWSIISNGYAFAVAIKTDGTMWSWGQNYFGNLGGGNVVYRSSPVQIGALTTWSKTSCQGYAAHAIKTDGTLWGWGRNANGDLGDGTTVYRSSPVQIGALTNWANVSGGYNGSVAIKTDGTLWSWGANDYGQVGDQTIVNRSSPVQVGALTTWSKLAAGNEFRLVVKTDSTLWAWGRNDYGQLAQNDRVARSSPIQVGLLTWNTVAASNSAFSPLAIKDDKTLWSWGRNQYGQLGLNDTVNRSSPVQIGSETWLAIATGVNHAIAIKK